jgi:hypothetical protein
MLERVRSIFCSIIIRQGNTPNSPSTQPHVAGEALLWRFFNSFTEGAVVGFGLVPTRARSASIPVGTGPSNAIADTNGRAVARLSMMEYCILKDFEENEYRYDGGEKPVRSRKAGGIYEPGGGSIKEACTTFE